MTNVIDQKADLTRSSIARYIQLSTLFRRRIESGVWGSGQQIPTVDELAEEFGVARATIRQAIGLLEADGLVSRFRAKGTFVNARPQVPVWCEVVTDWNGLLSNREGAEIEILRDYGEVPPPPLELKLGTASKSYRYLRRRHWLDGRPYLLADVYIDAQLSARLDESEFKVKTAMRLAASIPRVKIVAAQQILTVGSADIETAAQLQVQLNAPVCFVDRYVVDQRDRLILVAKGIYRGDIIRMDIKLK